MPSPYPLMGGKENPRMPWPEIFGALRAINYQGALVIVEKRGTGQILEDSRMLHYII
jgi:hypothetical protein